MYIFALLTFIFGTIIGSFLNVLVLRLKTGRGVTGRSFCFSCGKTLYALELIPLVSYLVLGGKCSKCKSPISIQYPLVEFTTGIVFAAIFLSLGEKLLLMSPLVLPYYFLMFSILIAISVYDMRHGIVPDGLVFTFDVVALLGLFLSYDLHSLITMPGLLDLLAGPLLFLPFFCLWFFSKGRWMGLGDGKLALGIGWMLGLAGGVSSIILAFWIGAAFALFLLIASSFSKKKVGLKSEVPFVPFMALGVLFAFLYHLDILHIPLLYSLFLS